MAKHVADRQSLESRRLAAIVESSDDAIVSKDLNGIVTSWNRASERMFGYTAKEMIGQSIRRIIPADRQSEEDDVVSHIRRGEKVDHFETIRQRKDGSFLPISLTVSPIVDDSGVVIGASKIARDISERKQSEAELARLLALAERNATITNTLNDVGAAVASALDSEAVAQKVTDAATQLTGAALGVFFYNLVDDRGPSAPLYTVSGASREDLSSSFAMSGKTPPFEAVFDGARAIRIDDATTDPNYGAHWPFHGLAHGDLRVRSCLAVPVKTRSGELLGGLVFGHPDARRFTADHQRIAKGIASWASVALENARLYRSSQDASRLKDEFLATLSHELRTPLNAILGYARMIRSGMLPGEKIPRAVETIERNAASLTVIVEDVLDVSRIISGKLRLNVRQVDVSALVRDAIEAAQPDAEAKEITIDSTLNHETGFITGDPERLQQVVWNLVSNAVKFTDRGGKVHVLLARLGNNVQLTVRDTGVGIAPEFLPHLFERFRQADAGMTRERGGLGLGLAIARQLVEMHGGAIEAASDGLGAGSSFTVTLPLTMRRGAHAGTREAAGTSYGTNRRRVPDLHGVRVLAVDDDADALAMVRDILESAGASVTTSRSGAQALLSLDEVLPDVLVADLGMPSMDGFELIAAVRRDSDQKLRNLPAAALTAYARSEDRKRALRSGFNMHLAKPIDPVELMAAVVSLSGRG